MQRISKAIILLAIIAVTAFGVDEAFAEAKGVVLVSDAEIIQIVAVGAAIAGSIVSVVNGWMTKVGGFNKKKMFSALLTSVTGSMFLVNLGTVAETTSGLTLFATVIMFFIIGWGADKGLAKLDK